MIGIKVEVHSLNSTRGPKRVGRKRIGNRTELEEEYLPRAGGFILVQNQPKIHPSPRRRQKIMLPNGSSSDPEAQTPAPISSSRLRADFRNMSPDSAEESKDRGILFPVRG